MIAKILKVWTLEFLKWGKKTFKRNEKEHKKIRDFFSTATILYPLWAQVFKSETISFHYFPQWLKNLEGFYIDLQEVGEKRPLNGARKTDKKNPAQ